MPRCCNLSQKRYNKKSLRKQEVQDQQGTTLPAAAAPLCCCTPTAPENAEHPEAPHISTQGHQPPWFHAWLPATARDVTAMQ